MNNRYRVIAVLALIAAAAAGRALSGELRDPMRPAGAPTVARSAPVRTLSLEGVISGETRVAIVNGRLVRAGDTIAGARILEVLPHGLRYERAGKVHTLSLSVTASNINVRAAHSRPEEVRP